ncbi:ATP-binding protein [Metabacillus sp. 84]|uniref:ATP-binding protein n=1 Tax=Metabacillus sp. 84 TaxID=3404705 RepID=UPI003CE88420
MIVEKLLLHVLIVLAPIQIHSVFFSERSIGRTSYLIGILHGFSAALCILFAYEGLGFFWDLRYVPLVLAFLYGGLHSGFIVLAAIFIMRPFVGGDALLYGYLIAILSAAGPMLAGKSFNKTEKKWQRVMWAVLAAFWAVIIQQGVVLSYMTASNADIVYTAEVSYFIFILGAIQMLGSGFAALLHEASIERNRLQEEIFRAEKLNTLGEMAASIAHEVRNPLTVVKGFLQLIKADDKKGNLPYLPLILSELDRAESIISSYLNFAKPQLEIVETFELSNFLKDVRQLLNPLALKKGVTLTCQAETKIILETDRNQLRQAMINLIKNAIEATPESGSVAILLSVEGEKAEITVADTGIGMTKEQLAKLGSLYYSTKEKGTGLGTMVSLGIIDAMEGKTVYKSQPGIGTTVKISLPYTAKENAGTYDPF